MRIRLQQIVVDSREPARAVRFWAALLGGEPVVRAGRDACRRHRRRRERSFHVLTDHDGNEFCFVSD